MSNGLVAPDISVVLPCYRGARLAIASVAELEAELARHPYSWEIIVVDDGGGDFPTDIWAAEDAVAGSRSGCCGCPSTRVRGRRYAPVCLPLEVRPGSSPTSICHTSRPWWS